MIFKMRLYLVQGWLPIQATPVIEKKNLESYLSGSVCAEIDSSPGYSLGVDMYKHV